MRGSEHLDVRHRRRRRSGGPSAGDVPRSPRRSTRRSRIAVLTAPAPGRRRTAGVLLVHRRLAIIDPGPGGAQPMATPDGRFHIVFNGEIYNYRELRADLESRGERFATGSDTEVLLRLVARDGAVAPRARARHVRVRLLGLRRTVAACRPRSVRHQAALRRGRRHVASRLRRRSARFGRRISSAARRRPPACWRFSMGQRAAAADVAARRGNARPGTWRRWRLDGREERGVFADARDIYAAVRRPRRCARRRTSGVSRRRRARRPRQRARASGRRRARRRVSLRRHRLGRAGLLRHVGRRGEPADVHRRLRR